MKATLHFLLVCCTFYYICSCQTLPDDTSTSIDQTLMVKARSSSNVEIKYPLYLYAFDKEGTCKASQIIQESSDSIHLSLSPGEYQIVAISNVSGGYILPERPNALEEITLQDSRGANTPMMMGKADVTIGNKEATLNITLSYVVTAVSIILKGVPSDVSTVQLAISPLYGAICMNGEYSQENYKLEIPCKLNTENHWIANSLYAFPGCGNETVFSILLTKKDETQTTYSYIYQGAPQANRPFNIGGNYSGDVTIGGELITQDWETAIDLEFNFGHTESLPEEDDTEDIPEDNEWDTLPKTGELINGYIVAGIDETNENGASILVMDTEEWACYASDAYSIPDEAGNNWRLPNAAEAKLLNETFCDESLAALNDLLYTNGYNTITTEKRYLYDNDGEIYAFGFKSTSKFQVAGVSTQYRVRLVKTLKEW